MRKVISGIIEFIIITLIMFGLIHLAAHIFLPVIIYLLTQFGLVEICGFLSCLFSSETSSLVIVYILEYSGLRMVLT